MIEDPLEFSPSEMTELGLDASFYRLGHYFVGSLKAANVTNPYPIICAGTNRPITYFIDKNADWYLLDTDDRNELVPFEYPETLDALLHDYVQRQHLQKRDSVEQYVFTHRADLLQAIVASMHTQYCAMLQSVATQFVRNSH